MNMQEMRAAKIGKVTCPCCGYEFDIQETTDEYEAFLHKFDAVKTTDDCYTPDNIYDVVADWVAEEYGLNRDNFVRPFFPGGDYIRHEYKPDSVVVDNPPFSILSEIINYYTKRKISYFLFAPAMTCFSNAATDGGAVLTCNAVITYENKATVPTAFVTSLEPEGVVARTVTELFRRVEEANNENLKAMKADLPKYSYPDHVITAAIMHRWCKYGVEFTLKKEDCVKIDALDMQKAQGKAIFGKGFLLSDRAAAERAAAERAAAVRWELSDREKEIVKRLGK